MPRFNQQVGTEHQPPDSGDTRAVRHWGDGFVLISWPTTRDAHADIADQFAAKLAQWRWQGRKRRKLTAELVKHLRELQAQTQRL